MRIKGALRPCDDALGQQPRGGHNWMRQTLAATGTGLWRWCMDDDRVFISNWDTPATLGDDDRAPIDTQTTSGDLLKRIHPDDAQSLIDQATQCVAGKLPLFDALFRVRTKTPDWLWVRGRGSIAQRDDTGQATCIGGIFFMIANQKETWHPRALKKRVAHFLSAIEQIEDAIVITDAQGNIEYANSAFETITGYRREAILGNNPRLLKSGVQDAAFYQHMWATLQSRDTWKGRLVNRRQNGDLYTEDAIISPVVNDDDTIAGYVAVKRDITKEMEIAEQLRHLEKMEALGHLAGGIAHDFNNIIGGIFGFAELSLMDAPDGSALQHNLNTIIKSGERARHLVDQILSFGRKKKNHPPRVFIGPILKEAIEMLRATLPSSIEFDIDVQPETAPVRINEDQIHEIAMNMGTNATHAMEGKGRFTISLTQQTYNAPWTGILGTSLPGTWSVLTFQDTGCGINDEVKAHIFEPFFTTKDVGTGTGMGLAVVFGIVQSSRGNIQVESAVGEGSTFRLFLPVCAETSAVNHRQQDSADTPKTAAHILLVDDETALVKAFSAALESMGYRVTSRTNPVEALALFHRNPYQFDAVVTDQTMPGLTGLELTWKLLQARPNIPIVMCTGYSESVSQDVAQKTGVKRFLHKPLRPRDLDNVLQEVLNER